MNIGAGARTIELQAEVQETRKVTVPFSSLPETEIDAVTAST